MYKRDPERLYPDFNFNSARQVTNEECDILFDLAVDIDAKNILEIGTFGGLTTLWLAFGAINKVITFDYRRNDIEPKPFVTARKNVIDDKIIFNYIDDLKKSKVALQDAANIADMIVFVSMHNATDKIWNIIKDSIKPGTLIAMHNVDCNYAEEMKIPDVFDKLKDEHDNYNIIKTLDDGKNLNSIGTFNFKEQVVIKQPELTSKLVEEKVKKKPKRAKKVKATEEPKSEDE